MTGTANPRVTVVITTHNRKELLEQSIQSVLTQQGVSLELIVVDDASSDGTRDWLLSFADPRVQAISLQEPSERAAGRNRGLAGARGEYIMFLDDDDRLLPGALQVLCGALDAHRDAVAAVGARWVWFTAEDYERRDAHPRIPRLRNVFDEVLFGWSAVSGQNLYRTDIVRQTGGFDGSVIPCEDRDLWLHMAACGKVVLRPETVLVYRLHPSQWRPRNIREIRERVARRAIRGMPSAKRRQGLALRRSNKLIDNAEDAISAGQFLAGLRYTLMALAAAPHIFLSPLIGEWIFRRLAGRAARYFFSPARSKA